MSRARWRLRIATLVFACVVIAGACTSPDDESADTTSPAGPTTVGGEGTGTDATTTDGADSSDPSRTTSTEPQTTTVSSSATDERNGPSPSRPEGGSAGGSTGSTTGTTTPNSASIGDDNVTTASTATTTSLTPASGSTSTSPPPTTGQSTGTSPRTPTTEPPTPPPDPPTPTPDPPTPTIDPDPDPPTPTIDPPGPAPLDDSQVAAYVATELFRVPNGNRACLDNEETPEIIRLIGTDPVFEPNTAWAAIDRPVIGGDLVIVCSVMDDATLPFTLTIEQSTAGGTYTEEIEIRRDSRVAQLPSDTDIALTAVMPARNATRFIGLTHSIDSAPGDPRLFLNQLFFYLPHDRPAGQWTIRFETQDGQTSAAEVELEAPCSARRSARYRGPSPLDFDVRAIGLVPPPGSGFAPFPTSTQNCRILRDTTGLSEEEATAILGRQLEAFGASRDQLSFVNGECATGAASIGAVSYDLIPPTIDVRWFPGAWLFPPDFAEFPRFPPRTSSFLVPVTIDCPAIPDGLLETPWPTVESTLNRLGIGFKGWSFEIDGDCRSDLVADGSGLVRQVNNLRRGALRRFPSDLPFPDPPTVGDRVNPLELDCLVANLGGSSALRDVVFGIDVFRRMPGAEVEVTVPGGSVFVAKADGFGSFNIPVQDLGTYSIRGLPYTFPNGAKATTTDTYSVTLEGLGDSVERFNFTYIFD